MTVFTMFFIELLASRFDIFGHQDLEGVDPAMELIVRKSTLQRKPLDEEAAYRERELNALPFFAKSLVVCNWGVNQFFPYL